MKLKVLLGLLLVLFAANLSQAKLQVDFTFKDLEGQIYTPASLKDKPIVIYVGSTFWRNCSDSAPDLQQAYVTYKDAGIAFIGAFYMSKTEAIKQFREKYHITFPVGKAKGVANELRVETIPETIFLSRDRKIVKRIRGKMSARELNESVQLLLQ